MSPKQQQHNNTAVVANSRSLHILASVPPGTARIFTHEQDKSQSTRHTYGQGKPTEENLPTTGDTLPDTKCSITLQFVPIINSLVQFSHSK